MPPSDYSGAPSVERDLSPSDEMEQGCTLVPSVEQEEHVR